jgi:N-acetylmuramoyl-L-alanine amidase
LCIIRLCDLESSVSAHYLIEEDGKVFLLVEEEKRAWHAGVSIWEDDQDLNDLSIGIELVNTGHPFPGYESVYQDFPEEQMQSLIKLSQEIIARHHIKPWHILGHGDVAWRRKIDPGELFDWKRLAALGIGVWPNDKSNDDHKDVNLEDFLQKLKLYGYGTEGCENNLNKLISAFQMHFRQKNIDGILDVETTLILENLLKMKIS